MLVEIKSELRQRGRTATTRAVQAARHLLPRLVQPLCFLTVGASGLAVNSAMLWALVHWLQLPVLLASVLATETAVLSNFLLNNYWTFRARSTGRSLLARALRFNLAMVGGMLLTVGILALLTHFTALPLLLANLIAVGCATGWNYLSSSRWAWNRAA